MMTIEDLEKEIPELLEYTKSMPSEIRRSAFIKIYPPGRLIHQKDCELHFFGIVAKGENRVINEFENGKIYMIETNKAIDFIGEVTLLAEMPRTSVTIEAVTECTVIYISRKEAENWIRNDSHILRLMAKRTAFKLYRSSYNNGLKLYYPPAFLLADYLVRAYESSLSEKTDAVFPENGAFILQKIRERLCEELGMNIKTLDRTIRSMQKDGYFSLTKGKISFGYEEYKKMKAFITTAKG
ncbi:Crp/Fnr family transcriptional regulator [Blautia sp.]|uniref:Crp/Fnr family transcriptional regulator n=1 Tax=Blautia sp. TaxID=1955243 RepID=UPI002F414A91